MPLGKAMGACGWSGVGIETIRRVGKRDIESGSAGGCLIVRDQGESDVGHAEILSSRGVGAVGEVVRNVGFRRAEL